MKRSVLAFAMILLASCSAESPDAGGEESEWRHERIEEEGRTIVRTLAGSKWGGPGVLVEELSIGVLEGADEYIFGQSVAVAVDDERVYVADSQPASLRVYSRDDGTYLYSIGAEGEGPGEYLIPTTLRVVGDQLFVYDASGSRITVYGVDGTYQYRLRTTDFAVGQFVVADDGQAYVQTMQFLGEDGVPLPRDERRWGLLAVDQNGPVGDPFLAPPAEFDSDEYGLVVEGNRIGGGVPYAPGVPTGIASAPAVVSGVSSEYAFDIHFLDGRLVRAERYWKPVPLSDAERAHHRAFTTARLRMRVPDWSWNGPDVPLHKPAYASIIPDHGDRILIVRHRRGERGEDCVESPTLAQMQARENMCWAPAYAWDFFDLEGNYLGEVIRPDVRILGWPFMRDDTFAFAVDDDDGAVRIRLYRLALPADREDS